MTFSKEEKSSKQLAILEFIWKRINSQGYPPTVREIGEAVDLSSTSTVHGHLSRLEKKGFIVKNPAKPRALEITEDGLKKLGVNTHPGQIPVLGTVAAGEPILAVEDTSEFFSMPEQYDNSDEIFMLTIQGESMINIGILNGDKVIVRKQSTANNGDIVIAMTSENEATCKRFFKESDHYRLQPENDNLDPIILDQVYIIGKVVGLFRDSVF
ncbi:MAG: transcriptional repressor LexA [Apilactobacillus sp.]|uniref:transcriptional repressor LexA n=1 Tax=Apilactobacillus sp. TaxID=2767901 RepID=UPI0025FF705E|nr:transcriptional repressor LexA [Apilactobacillus sp.]MCT6822489.1 transcriptional repressor LexA [Apilactobacillus sp.]MCT6857753.1 transcriptional repressor LexA [Apilactobacillus sp.]